MTDSSTDLESDKSRDPGEPARSPAPATIVGLGRPEPPLAGTSAYVDEPAQDMVAKHTLVVGFPGAPLEEPQAEPHAEPDAPPPAPVELADASDDDDAVTVVGGYDDVTVVTPWDASALARVLPDPHAGARPVDLADSPEDDDAWPEAPLDTSPEAGSEPLGDDTPPPRVEAAPDSLAITTREPLLAAFAETMRAPPLEAMAAALDAMSDSFDASSADVMTASTDSAPESSLELGPEPALAIATTLRAPPFLGSVSKPPPPPRPRGREARHESLPPPSSDHDLFVSRDTELQLFAPPLEMFGPGSPAESRTDSSPPPQPSPVGMQSDAPWYRPIERESAAPPRSRSRIAVVAVLAAALGAGAVFSGVFAPKTGRVLVTVSGPLDAPVAGAAVLVDGKHACSPTPCRVTLDEGAYVFSVVAPAYRRAAEKSLSVPPGDEEAIHFMLVPSDSAGLEIKSEVAGLRVLVDGLERGTTPTTVRGLSPGKHSVLIIGNARYAPVETELELESDRVTRFEPKLSPQPEVVAAEELGKKPSSSGSLAPKTAPVPAAKSRAPSTTPAVVAAKIDLDAPEAAPQPQAQTATLNLTSTPPSNVVVDGRPIGTTPRQVEVSAGEHSVVFIHPSKGRKSVRVRATGGKPAVASVQF